MKELWLSNRFRTLWEGRDPFDEVERLQGEVFRRVTSRRTIRVTIDGAPYFAKIHHGVGWREIFKNLLHLKLPVLSAQNEWTALNLLALIGVPTMTPVAFGRTGSNPARIRSFLITEELTGTTSLEDFCAAWPAQPPAFRLRKALTEQVASSVRQMHAHGINHRDCYLCHFHLDTASGWDEAPGARPQGRGTREGLPPPPVPLAPSPTARAEAGGSRPEGRNPPTLAPPAPSPALYVIDLHRAQIRRRTPRRWLIKDLAGLYFSAMDIGMTRTDRLRFIRAYEQRPLREILRDRKSFWRRVERTALALRRKLSR